MPAPRTTAADRRELLLAAIDDLQGSVHANDSKSAAVLIAHGLFLTAVVTITSRIGSLLKHAGVAMRVVIATELGLALLFFVTSVVVLLLAVTPRRPTDEFISRNRDGNPTPPDFFYPEPGSLPVPPGGSETGGLLERVEDLTKHAAEVELAYELVKVQRIQLDQARFAKWGSWLFLPEAVLVTAYLFTIGIYALVQA